MFSVFLSCRHLGRRHGIGLVIGGIWRSAVMGSVRASLIIEIHPMADPGFGLATATPGVQVNALIFGLCSDLGDGRLGGDVG